MNKLVRLVLVLIYLLAVSGVSIVRHYCADELSSVSLSSDAGCGSCTDTEDTCCSTETIQSEVQSEHAPAALLKFSPLYQVMEVLLPSSYNQFILEKTERFVRFFDRGPPHWAKIQTFLSWIAAWRK
jgi:hypothetical protein